MKTRTLKRKVIIREYDFHKVYGDALNLGFATSYVLYDRADFQPLTFSAIEKLNLLDMLKGKERKYTNLEIPNIMLFHLRDYLYDPRYIDWKVEYDTDGQLWVQSRKNTPRTRLGWGIFEKDLTCRI